MVKICKHCSSEFESRYHARKFCSVACSNKSRTSKVEYLCGYCNKVIMRYPLKVARNKTGFVFCNRECKMSAQSVSGGEKFISMRPAHYGTSGIASYRKRALEKYGAACIQCGYDENILALEVDHIDGNRQNNNLGNLQVLCANCHKIKTLGT